MVELMLLLSFLFFIHESFVLQMENFLCEFFLKVNLSTRKNYLYKNWINLEFFICSDDASIIISFEIFWYYLVQTLYDKEYIVKLWCMTKSGEWRYNDKIKIKCQYRDILTK